VSTNNKEGSGATTRDYRIGPDSPWAGAWKIAGGIGLVGLVFSYYGYRTDPTRFAFSYLFGFFVSLSLALGSLFFVLVLYMTKAAWGVTVRRIAELFMRPMGVLAILVIPLVFTLPQLFPWVTPKHLEAAPSGSVAGEHAATSEETEAALAEARGIAAREPVAVRDLYRPPTAPSTEVKRLVSAEESAENQIVAHKRPFLNVRFFLARLFFYIVVWSWLAFRYFQWSSDQDKTKAVANTAAAQRFAPVALLLFAFTLSFFAFDWLLSLDATWYSTIFGVYVFAQCALFQMAVLILVTLLLRRSGLLGEAVNIEHYHDMGKLLFGWVVFWSYVTFAQFFLTWYANIPDEVAWFHKRWGDNGGTWKGVSWAIIAFHCVVPFWFLLSRNIKRHLPLLALGATCLVVMHVVEVYWIIMPNLGPLSPSLIDLSAFVGVFGIYLAATLRGMVDYSLVPIGDPRLARALDFENA
jgi:hypothetical protein